MNYNTLTDTELLNELSTLLTSEEIKSMDAMTSGLKLKVEALNNLKRLLLASNPDKAVETLELELARGLARTKMLEGTSLALNKNKKLALLTHFKGSEEPPKPMIDNFRFMADLTNFDDKSLELMLIESAFKKVLDLSNSMLENLSAELVLEVKRRVTGIKQVSKEDADLLKL